MECGTERPCPFVGCKYHLYLDVNPGTGTIKLNFPRLEPWQMGETCVLDVAERGGMTLEQIGAELNMVRERVRQIERSALARIALPMEGYRSAPPREYSYSRDRVQAASRASIPPRPLVEKYKNPPQCTCCDPSWPHCGCGCLEECQLHKHLAQTENHDGGL